MGNPEAFVSRRLRRVSAGLAVALAGALVLAGAASATPTWLPPATLSQTGQDANEPDLAMDALGDMTSVWYRYDGSNYRVQTAYRPAGGTWGVGLNLSPAGQNARSPHVAMDPAGDTIATWRRYDGSNYVIQAATRPLGGSWSIATLSAPGQSARQPAVAISINGVGAAVWRRYDGTNDVIQADVFSGGAWGAPVTLSDDSQGAFDPHVAVDGNGNVYVVWDRYDGSNYRIQAATLPFGGAPTTPATLSDSGQHAFDSHVASDPNGNVTAVWHRYDGSAYVVQGTSMPAGGSFGAAQTLSDPGRNAFDQHVAMDAAGNAYVAWGQYDGTNYVARYATLPLGGSWSSPQTLSFDGAHAYNEFIAVNAAGEVFVVWDRYDNSADEEFIQASLRSPAGAWSGPFNISDPTRSSYDPRAALDAQGDGAVGFVGQDYNYYYATQVAGYDANGPRLNSLSIPATGQPGVPLMFSVAPLDVFTQIPTTMWAFGDGAGASGNVVGHTYGQAGTYRVVVASNDAVGNVTSFATNIVIAAPKSTTTGGGGGGGGGGAGGGGGGRGTSNVFTGSTLGSTTLTVDANGNVTLELNCPATAAGGSCDDVVDLFSPTGTLPSTATAAAKKKSSRATRIARGHFRVPAGRTVKVKLHLNAAGKQLVKSKSRVSARLLITSRAGSGPSKTRRYRVTLVTSKKKK